MTDKPHGMTSFVFSTKAGTLAAVEGKVTTFRIPRFRRFTVDRWRSSRAQTIAEIRALETPTETRVIVRSSAVDEDADGSSLAGKYLSITGVDLRDELALSTAIDGVIASYNRSGAEQETLDEILVQLTVSDVAVSGVAFTRELGSGAPYLAINYDDHTGRTDTVTSGNGLYSNRTLYVHRGAVGAVRSPRFRRLIEAVAELESVCVSDALDIEFAIDQDGETWLLQVRPLALEPMDALVEEGIEDALSGVRRFVADRQQPQRGTLGCRSVFGQMPDWNPAEMLGRVPRPLAFSLYRDLITDSSWRRAREMMGYHVPDGQPLMVALAGQPFIDARLSFHSLVPSTVPLELSERLVDAWLDRLVDRPDLHDKIEFEVAFTAFEFDLPARIAERYPDQFTRREIAMLVAAYEEHARQEVGVDRGSFGWAEERIECLQAWQAKADETEQIDELAAIRALIERCRDWGTLPFAILARHAFVAESLLRSLVRLDVVSRDEASSFRAGITTIATDLVDDLTRLAAGTLDPDRFLARYGHLRPGTYDITSLRYDQMPLDALSRRDVPGQHMNATSGGAGATFGPRTLERLERFLGDSPFDGSVEDFIAYLRRAPVAREYAKFAFTRSVSDVLECVARYGAHVGITRGDMAYLPIGTILDSQLVPRPGESREELGRLIRDAKMHHRVASSVRLPQVLFDVAGVDVIPFQIARPNFITNKAIRARAVRLSAQSAAPSLHGSIVIIEGADPGFDWIFAQGIRGLVTKFGGANSHMAIRCAEFGIPAAIGCGEQLFERLASASVIELDCSAETVVPTSA